MNVEIEMNTNANNPIAIREVSTETGKYLLAMPNFIEGDTNEVSIFDGTTEYSLFVKPDMYQKTFLRNLEHMAGKDPKEGFEALIETRKGELFDNMHQEKSAVKYNPNFDECAELRDIILDY